ncbi:MAG: hypothetical protein KUG77_04215 [Nannocystaceae bacterium]|nr:hypothetical protein [Nannocystaceae bacterium]
MDKVPDLLVEHLALGLLVPHDALALREQLDREGDSRLEALAASDAEILRQYPPKMMATRIKRHLEPEPPAWRRWVLAGSGVAAAMVAIWWMAAPRATTAPDGTQQVAVARTPTLPSEFKAPRTPVEPGVRTKGNPHLMLHRKTAEGSTPLLPGDTVAAGEFIQIGYQSGGAAFGVIASIDGAGAVTLHQPLRIDGSTALQQGKAWLDFSLELDEAPDFERFVFVTAPQALDAREVLKLVEGLAAADDRRDTPLIVPAPWSHASFLITKPQ